MVSRMFAKYWDVLDYSTPTANLPQTPESTKKRKADEVPSTAAPKVKANAAGYIPSAVYGKKSSAPGGTGYSGAATEDVRPSRSARKSTTPDSLILFFRTLSARVRRRPSLPSRSTTESWRSFSSKFGSSCPISDEKEEARRATTSLILRHWPSSDGASTLSLADCSRMTVSCKSRLSLRSAKTDLFFCSLQR